MLCLLCANHSVPNFYFVRRRSRVSTVKHIGVIDLKQRDQGADVLYRRTFSSVSTTKSSGQKSAPGRYETRHNWKSAADRASVSGQ